MTRLVSVNVCQVEGAAIISSDTLNVHDRRVGEISPDSVFAFFSV